MWEINNKTAKGYGQAAKRNLAAMQDVLHGSMEECWLLYCIPLGSLL
jgi:hypothetical protein